MVRRLSLALLLTAACAKESAAPPKQPAQSSAAGLSARELLIRGSLDLRGIRPSESELQAAESNPDSVATTLAGFVNDARFGARVRAIFSPAYRTQIDSYRVSAKEYGLTDENAFQASIGEEALRLLSHIAENDRPYTELVTGDYTVANEILGKVWPLDYPPGSSGWKVAHYTDGRPHAGVLATNSLWWRYQSDGVNYNRGRANAISRILLCQDHLERPVDFPRDVDLSNQDVVLHATQTNTGCVNCHVSVDPLGSYLYGFQYQGYGAAEMTRYHPEREVAWRRTTGIAPSFFGKPGYTLSDLGQQIAGDPRFIDCAVRRVFEGLLRRDATPDAIDAITAHREVFLKSGLKLKALFASVATDERYIASLSDEQGGVRRKMKTPDLLASSIEALTGFRWTVNGRDILEVDAMGLRSLAGGADASGAGASTAPNASVLLVQERLAELAASTVTKADAQPGSTRKLFQHATFKELPGDAVIAKELQSLHRRLFGTQVETSSAEVQAGVALWAELYNINRNPVEAWAGTLAALLRDPDFLFY
jgi:hypothetical protein